jgi:hypothetical protein
MPDNYALSPNDRKAQESYAVGTRDLVFLQIDVTCASGNLDTTLTASDSNFSQLIQCLQQVLELYGIGNPNSQSEVTVIVSRSTIPYADGEEANAGGRVAALEALINAHPSFSSAVVFQGQINGWSIENDC